MCDEGGEWRRCGDRDFGEGRESRPQSAVKVRLTRWHGGKGQRAEALLRDETTHFICVSTFVNMLPRITRTRLLKVFGQTAAAVCCASHLQFSCSRAVCTTLVGSVKAGGQRVH